jgi:hypothetical protein
MNSTDENEVQTKTARLDELVTRLRAAASNDALDIGTAWNLLDEASDVIERLFFALEHETECPCCQEKAHCAEGCTYSEDSYNGYGRMQFIRGLMSYSTCARSEKASAEK